MHSVNKHSRYANDQKERKLDEKTNTYFNPKPNYKSSILDIIEVCEIAIALAKFDQTQIFFIFQEHLINLNEFGDGISTIIPSSVYRLLITVIALSKSIYYKPLKIREILDINIFIRFYIKKLSLY